MDISIIVPSYNRKERLKQCLGSIFLQDFPKDKFEVIVIDDGSTDGTKDMLEGMSRERKNFRYFSQSRRGPATARNLGMKHSRSEIVGFTDNDCILAKDWARRMVEAHRACETASAIGGSTRVDPRNIKAVVSQFLSDGAIHVDINGNKEVVFFPTCNVSLKKTLIKNEEFNGSFPLPAGEDLDFFWRLFKKGHKFIYRKDIVIFHDCHPGVVSFLRQAYFYGRGNFLVQHLHRDQPLLKELNTGNKFSFALATLVNFIKIPRFSYLLGRRLMNAKNNLNLVEKLKVYFYFALHKAVYLSGNIAEYRSLKKGVDISAKPEYIILDITHKCNLKCNICEIRSDGSKEELKTGEVKDLLFEAKDWGIKEFVLSGGEALLRSDIFEILDFVRDIKYRIGILTNGIVLDGAFINRLLPYFACGRLSLSISLDALSAHIHDDIRGQEGSFEKTMTALEALSKLKKSGQNINFNTISIVLGHNLDELLPLAHRLKTFGVNSIQFQPLLANNLIMKERSSRVKYWIQPDTLYLLDTTLDSLVDFKRQNPGLVRNSEHNLILMKKYFRNLLTQQDVKCGYGSKTVLIAKNGDVTTCFDCYGNIKRKSLKSIFFSKEADKARDRLKDCNHPCLLPCFCDL
ncbi:MAG: glycosyltransferase [Candidatus Omnitrophica bacterium]|nr:glycosyltransferase [Candidatus Omnitrophota bacterium]